VYVCVKDQLEFRRVPPPTKLELDQLLQTITTRVGRHLQRRGWLTRDAESSHLSLDRKDTALDSLLSHSINYRIALGPRAGQKAFTLQSLPGTSRRAPTASPCTRAWPPGPMNGRRSSGCPSPARVSCARC